VGRVLGYNRQTCERRSESGAKEWRKRENEKSLKKKFRSGGKKRLMSVIKRESRGERCPKFARDPKGQERCREGDKSSGKKGCFG